MQPITASRGRAWTIGQLSRLTGVNIETIRYYEKIKLLPAPLRTASGRRIYGPRDMRSLAFIRRSRELGFALSEIRSLLALEDAPAGASCRDVRDIAARHLEDIRTKLKDLAKLERLLAKTIVRCTGRTIPECPILDILDVQRTGRPKTFQLGMGTSTKKVSKA